MKCTTWEIKLIDFIRKNVTTLFFIVVSILGLVIRYVTKEYVSADARDYLLPWFYEIKNAGGFGSLSKQVGNYGIPYQIIIAVLTYVKLNPLSLYKMVSILFDYILALVVYCVVREIRKSQKIAVMGYAIILLSPNVIMNSALWAQCDAMYTAMIMCSILFFLKEKNNIGFVCYAIALSFKLQAIFYLPVILILYIKRKAFSIVNFLWIPIINIVMSIPAFIMGRSILSIFEIYNSQISEYKYMTLNWANFWTVLDVGDQYDIMSKVAIIITISVLGGGLYWVLEKNNEDISKEVFIKLAIWSAWTCVLFLPAMHERYGFLVDILLIVLALIDVKYIIYAVIFNGISCRCYTIYLFENGNVNMLFLGIINVLIWVLFSKNICGIEHNEYVKKQHKKNGSNS